MLTKAQKTEQVQLASQAIKDNRNVIFVDFSGVSDEQLKALKNELREKGAQMKVLKKRLLAIALKEVGIEFDTMSKKTPLATIFNPEELTDVAGTIFKFGKQFKDDEGKFDVLGVYDKDREGMISRDEFLVIAQLPSKEVLLATVMGGITGPLRAFMSILSQLSEKKEELSESKMDEKTEEAASEEKLENKEE